MLQKLIGDIYKHSQPPSCADHPLKTTLKRAKNVVILLAAKFDLLVAKKCLSQV